MSNETAPIKRSQALIQFSREHHFVLLLVWKIRQGLNMNIEPERISDYAIFFYENQLSPHFKEEEKDLFSKLPATDTLRLQAFMEHEEICKMIDSIKNDKVNTSLLKEFADTLDQHTRFEERTLFNHLQNMLSEEEQKDLEEGHSKREGDIDIKWKDHFWVLN